jgi:Na+-translocating ferredoxin:NAD+ oxidoreductase RnfG subunit
MLKKIICVVTFLFFSVTFWGVSYAVRILDKEEALERLFGSDVKVTIETKELNGNKLSIIKKRLGGKLVHFQEGSKSEMVTSATKVDFYVVTKDGKKVGVAIIDVEPGKWGPVEFIIGLNGSGIVKRVEVMAYKEKRGQLHDVTLCDNMKARRARIP